MLKEQVAILIQGHYGDNKEPQLVRQILNLFKAEVDKLTVIDDDERWEHFNNSGLIEEEHWNTNSLIEAQLQHTKKQLLDLMGE